MTLSLSGNKGKQSIKRKVKLNILKLLMTEIIFSDKHSPIKNLENYKE